MATQRVEVTAAPVLELETMYLTREGQVDTIWLNRPDALNAGNLQWVEDLTVMAKRVATDPAARIVVVRGRGRAFCSGIDLKVVSTGQYDFDWFRRWEEAVTAFEAMEKVSIAAIHGYCVGGGLQLALACDIRIARADGVLGLPAAMEGLIPGLGAYRLARYIGMGRAKYLALTGELISAQEAFDLGIVNYVVKEPEFERTLGDVTQKLLLGPMTAQVRTKKMTNMSFDLDFREIFAEYLKMQKEAVDSPDHQAAAAAYRKKKGIGDKYGR